MVFCQASQESAETAVEQMLAGANPPTIIFTSNNDMLLAVLRVAGKLGITIGKKLSVVSFDDSPWTAAMSPAITVISRPVDELGSRAVSALLDQMRGEAPAGDVVMPTLLIERDSVAKLRV
jgi:LacI family transcriptional regulator